MTNNLIDFLNARFDEAEASTRELLAEAQRVSLSLKEPRLLGKEIPGWGSWRDVERMCTDRLAEVEANRRILTEHPKSEHRDECRTCFDPDTAPGDYDFETFPCPTLRALALPYADHPDCHPGWRPR